VPFGKINHIFISHLHGDHVFGLPGLLSTFNLLGRLHELHIYAHKSLKQILNQFLGQFYTRLGYELVYHALDEENFSQIYEDKSVEVFSFPLNHRVACNGFLFREKEKLRNIKKEVIPMYNIPIRDMFNIKKGADYITEDGTRIPNQLLTVDAPSPKSFAYLTDTTFLPEVAGYIKGVNLLYHESTFLNQDTGLAAETGHSTPEQAATMASLADASELILGHFSTRYNNYNLFLDQARAVFSNTKLAEDGKVFEI
jgi:ribonuclease Z